ncbi:MAG TPA: peptide ABC transporter substrate-binding protein [Candidatus Acidoferrales bacterium]|nr:peptide ABC transporter substrate-binding protein [Candidatus Acidoferrales bacterium]
MKRLFALAALAGILAGCSKVSNGSGGDHSWTQPGVLRIALQTEPKNLDPLLTSETTDVFVSRFMFLPLIQPDGNGVQQPLLATEVPTRANGGVSADGLTITYHLRKDVKWSDGVPVTSKDVKWTWTAIMNPNNNIVSRHGYDEVKSVDTPDPYTVIVHLKEKFSPFVNTFFTDSDQPYSVAPEHVLAKYPNVNQIPFNSEPTVTDGPFRFGEWVHNDHISLVANQNFFLGKPGLDRIEIKIIPDENTSVEEFKAHAIDWIYQASIHLYPQVKDTEGTKIVWMRVNGYYDVQFNTASPSLKNVLVRQAIAYAIDKQSLVNTTMYGQETPATEDIPDWMWAYDPTLKSYPYDVDKARQLLTQAGYSPGANGMMQKGGAPLSLLLVTENSNVTYRQLALLVQAQLRRVGIDSQIKLFPGAQLYAPAGEGGILQLGHFDLIVDGWYSGIDPDDSAQFMCENVPPGGYNYSRYCSPEMDAAETMALTHYDQATRKAAYAKTQALLARDVPELFINWLRQMHPINADFKGLDPNPVVENWNAWQWSI